MPEPERRLRQYPHQLSGGLRQRVAVAVALAPNPELLIADEPTTALDVTIQAQLLELLQREREDRGMALLLITHDLGVVAGLADQICVMYAGRIVERGSTDDAVRRVRAAPVYARAPPQRAAARRRARATPRLDPGRAARPLGAGRGCAFRPRCPIALDRCASEDPELLPAGEAGSAVACWASVREPAA